jgi:hypothetical protein
MSTTERFIDMVQSGARIVIRYDTGSHVVYQKLDAMYWTWTYTSGYLNGTGKTQTYAMVREVLEMIEIGEATLV